MPTPSGPGRKPGRPSSPSLPSITRIGAGTGRVHHDDERTPPRRRSVEDNTELAVQPLGRHLPPVHRRAAHGGAGQIG